MDILKREMPTTLERVDRRTLACRYCPWDVVADVVDIVEGTVDRYREEFAPSVFDRQLQAASKADGVLQRISLVDEHGGGGKVGFTVELRRENDGLYGLARLMPSKIDDVEALLEEGVDKLSVEFFPHRGGTKITPDGVRRRTDAHLHRVALVPEGAYTGAEVLAVREAQDMVDAVAAEYQAEMDDLDAWLAEAQAKQDEWAKRIGA